MVDFEVSENFVPEATDTHVEVTAVNGANRLALTTRGIKDSGATITSPTTAWWQLNGGDP